MTELNLLGILLERVRAVVFAARELMSIAKSTVVNKPLLRDKGQGGAKVQHSCGRKISFCKKAETHPEPGLLINPPSHIEDNTLFLPLQGYHSFVSVRIGVIEGDQLLTRQEG